MHGILLPETQRLRPRGLSLGDADLMLAFCNEPSTGLTRKLRLRYGKMIPISGEDDEVCICAMELGNK